MSNSTNIAERPPAVFVPGGILPAALSYGPLLEVLGDTVQAVVKDLEVYATGTPPPNYSVELEIGGISRVAIEAGLETFHLVGYSGGGGVALAFAAEHPERLRSLALIEPLMGGFEKTPEDLADRAERDHIRALPPTERVTALVRYTLRAGVVPPPRPAGPPPPWIAKRPVAIDVVYEAFDSYELEPVRLRAFRKPVYYALGSLSNERFERRAQKLAALFPDFRVEVYEGRHHFDPPHRAEPERFAEALRNLWRRAAKPAATASSVG